MTSKQSADDTRTEHYLQRDEDKAPRNAGAQRSRIGRRRFLQTIGTTVVASTIAGCLGNPESNTDGDYPDSFSDNGDPEYGDWFDNVDNYAGTVDARGEDEIVIAVGANSGLTFDPAAVLIEPGATVVWEWTGDGGQHDVAHVDGVFESELTGEAGHIFDHTFGETGLYRYVCNPHQQAGMKGAVAVREDENDDSELEASSSEGQ